MLILNILTNRQMIKFAYGKSEASVKVDRIVDKFIFGRIGKRKNIIKTLPPEENFKEVSEENWPNYRFIINTDTDSNSGQYIAIEDKSILLPASYVVLLRKFAEEINKDIEKYGYLMSVNSVNSQEVFWDIVNRNEGKITELSFVYKAPNLFQAADSLSEELKKCKEDYHTTEVSLNLKNDSGKLDVPNDKLIQQSIEYINKGGGEYRLKIKGRKTIYNSSQTGKTQTVEVDYDATSNSEDVLKSIAKDIFKDV